MSTSFWECTQCGNKNDMGLENCGRCMPMKSTKNRVVDDCSWGCRHVRELHKERDEWKTRAEEAVSALTMLLDSLEGVDPESIGTIRKAFFDQINRR